MKWAVLVGGAGTNLQALVEAGIPVNLVVSHRAEVGALAIAAAHGIPSRVLLARQFADRSQYDRALLAVLQEFTIDAVALAGFLRWLGADLLRGFSGPVLNLHPSLLPAYAGLGAIERAYADRVLWSGVTVHFVDEGHDSGPVVGQVPVPRELDDTLEDFSARIHAAEHRLYPLVVGAVDAGRVRLEAGQVVYGKGEGQWMHGRY